MKTLYLTDLDGTLLNSETKLSDRSFQILNRLIEANIPVSYATARSLSSVGLVLRELVPKIPAIVYNGAFLVDARTGNVLFSSAFSPQKQQEIRQLIEQCSVTPLVYARIRGEEKVSWISGRENEGMQYYLSQRKGDRRFRPVDTAEQLYQGEAFYYTCIGSRKQLTPFYERLKEVEQIRCTFQQELYREEYWCEIMPEQATKAKAMQRLKELCGCDRIVCFGDAVNDIPMFQAADECYAVENAVAELKSLADGILPSNDEDSVALWMEQHCKQGEEGG